MKFGFSPIKLFTAAAIFSFTLAGVLFYLSRPAQTAAPDRQAQQVIEMFQEARRRSFSENETMRVEIDLTAQVLRLIDENQKSNPEDDRPLKEVPLQPENQAKLYDRPREIPINPTEIMPVPVAQFRTSKYPASLSHAVCTLRFMPDGTIFNEGTDNNASNATSVGLSLFIWTPKFTSKNESESARAITVIGGTGSVRFWEYRRELSEVDKWKNAGELISTFDQTPPPNDTRAARVLPKTFN